jgi:hypothetical protein
MLTEAADVERALLPAALALGFDVDSCVSKERKANATPTPKSSGQECPLHTLSSSRLPAASALRYSFNHV